MVHCFLLLRPFSFFGAQDTTFSCSSSSLLHLLASLSLVSLLGLYCPDLYKLKCLRFSPAHLFSLHIYTLISCRPMGINFINTLTRSNFLSPVLNFFLEFQIHMHHCPINIFTQMSKRHPKHKMSKTKLLISLLSENVSIIPFLFSANGFSVHLHLRIIFDSSLSHLIHQKILPALHSKYIQNFTTAHNSFTTTTKPPSSSCLNYFNSLLIGIC